MRRPLIAIGLAASLGLFGAPPALAANPDVNHFVDADSFTDPDFCGTGQPVEVSYRTVVTEQLSPRGAEYVNTFQDTTTFTNVATGDTVIGHSAGRFTDVIISGDPEGIHTHDFTNVGLPEQFRLEHGRMLTLDAGTITFRQTFDGDEFLSGEIIQHGPHPEADADFQLFCEVLVPALGIE